MLWFLYDPLYLAVTLAGVALTAWAQFKLRSAYSRYSKVTVRSGMSGYEAAAAVCRAGNAGPVTIERVGGFLTDHYDPRSRTLRLSPEVYEGRSITSIAIAAHEAGHSIQHATSYRWLGFRSTMVQATNIGNRLWSIPFLIGMFLGAAPIGRFLMALGIMLFGAVVLFQIVTLPVEIDASRRAKAVLAHSGIVQSQDEAAGVSKVLDAAAWTYIAAAAAGALQLVYLISRFNRR
jgi:Zn-dependent membrane protease YugP